LILLGLPQKSSKKITGQISIFQLIPTYLKKKRASGIPVFIGNAEFFQNKKTRVFHKIKTQKND